MTSFIFKIIGIISMLFDHTGNSILKHFSYMNLIGRFAFPLFAFQIVVGYTHTKNLKKYIIKMLIFAIISQVPFMLFLSTYTQDFLLNVLFTFTLGLLAIYIYDKLKNKFLGFLCVIGISIIAQLIKVDYGAFGILVIFLFYFFKDNKLWAIIPYIILCFMKYIPDIIETPEVYLTYIQLAIFTAIPILLISFFNGKEGPKLKYFFYIFYPLHLTILWAIHYFI